MPCDLYVKFQHILNNQRTGLDIAAAWDKISLSKLTLEAAMQADSITPSGRPGRPRLSTNSVDQEMKQEEGREDARKSDAWFRRALRG